MSELSDVKEDLRYLRAQWDDFMRNGGPKCHAHDEAVAEVYIMKNEWTRIKGIAIACLVLIPSFSGLLAWIVIKSEAITARDIVEQVIAKLAAGG